MTILLALLIAPPPAGAAEELCLRCHPAHYRDRGDCRSCHRGDSNSGRKELAHHRLQRGRHVRYLLGETTEVRAGRELLERLACRRCHAIGGRGNRLAADLDRIVPTRSGDELDAALAKPAAAMPDFRLSAGQRDLLVNALYAAPSAAARSFGNPELVHFRPADRSEPDLFTRKCGPCHQALVPQWGALGRGRTAPDLSGLFTPFYPANFTPGGRWDSKRLGLWLQNPRAVRRWSTMRPVPLSAAELNEIAGLLGHK